jgi:hypothetical protein
MRRDVTAVHVPLGGRYRGPRALGVNVGAVFDMGVVGVARKARSYSIVGNVARRARSCRHVHHNLVAIRRGAPRRKPRFDPNYS